MSRGVSKGKRHVRLQEQAEILRERLGSDVSEGRITVEFVDGKVRIETDDPDAVRWLNWRLA